MMRINRYRGARFFMDARYTIETPEQIELAYEVAGIGSRFLAAIIDTLLLGLLQLLLAVAIFVVGTQFERFVASTTNTFSLLIAIWALLSFLLFWGYYLFFELLWNGQSPGKRLFGLRVVREGGRPITFAASAIRNLVRIIDFLPGFYGIGLVVMFIDRHARRLGDFTGGSLVVKEKRALSLAALTAQAPPFPPPFRPNDNPTAPTRTLPNLDQITNQDYDLVQSFLQRRSELRSERRKELGALLATKLCTRIVCPLDGDPEAFLEQLVYEYRMFRGSGG